MAEEEKKSFLLYFDASDHILRLPMDQRGMLFSALLAYARAEAAGSARQEGVLEQFPEMAPDTRMAFYFIGETIRRDTEKWRQKHRRYQAAAQKRNGRQEGPGGDSYLAELIRRRTD